VFLGECWDDDLEQRVFISCIFSGIKVPSSWSFLKYTEESDQVEAQKLETLVDGSF
jgi:uncharacterized protein (DUF2132 family)